jgi:hypothetical protein
MPHYSSVSTLQQNIASHQFQDDCEVESAASRWLITQDTEHYQHGVEKLSIFWGGGDYVTNQWAYCAINYELFLLQL